MYLSGLTCQQRNKKTRFVYLIVYASGVDRTIHWPTNVTNVPTSGDTTIPATQYYAFKFKLYYTISTGDIFELTDIVTNYNFETLNDVPTF